MNKKDEEVDQIYNKLKGQENKFSKEELEKLIVLDGFDKDVAKRVVNKLYDNKPNEEKPITTPQEKEKILAEISKSIKDQPKEKPPLVAPIKEKKNIFTTIFTFFKKIYFFFEDLYYSMVEGISKVVPISKLVDKIDKVFPSFIIFLVFIIALIWLIFFSGIFGSIFGGSPILEVTVTDTLSMPISGATAILSIGDINKTSQTGVFGETIFENFGKKKDAKLIVQKEAYNTETKELKLKRGNNTVTVKLEIDTTTQLYLMEPTTRNLIFKENDILLATKPINVNLRCANSGNVPDPNSKSTSSGQISVSVPRGCGDLRVDVSSEYYNSIQNTLVPENNVIMLKPITQNYGTLEITVRDQNTQVAIPGVFLQIYKPDDPTTQITESNIVVDSGTTTVYGTYVFTNLTPGAYTVTASKNGYVSALNRFGPYQVSLNNNTTGNILLATGGKTLNVALVDANGNTEREIKGDITLYTKTDTDIVTSIGIREDTNFATFSVPVDNSVTYRIAVTNTEEYGYVPDIKNIDGFDNNATITIPLEYSSELNTGKIGVNVSRSSYKVVGASVYLFREEDDDIPIAGPQITNRTGDCNFSLIRAGKKYYAYAIKSPEQGFSQTERLDANDFMALDVELENQATILNLKVTPTANYQIHFFKSNGDEVTNYVTARTSQDSNKEYIFKESSHKIYAIISAEGKATYQTSEITLIPGQRVYYSISLTNTKTNAFSNIELLGIYDESGNIKKETINLASDYSKTFKLKFKLTTINLENREQAYAYIRAGKRVSLPSDYLRLENVTAFNNENEFGCNFSGETTDWNQAHFLANYDIDQTQANCSASTSGFKWVKIDFSDSYAEQIEFFVDLKFLNGITNLSDYVFYYKGLTETKNEEYKLSPNLNNSWKDCDMVPDGYFYSPYHAHALSFNNSDNAFLFDIYDYNSDTKNIGQKLTPFGSNYILEIGKNYQYSQKLLYLKNNNNTGSITASSVNTYNNLIYKAYKLKVRNHTTNTPTDINETRVNASYYVTTSIAASLATQIDHNAVISAKGFFMNTSLGGPNQSALPGVVGQASHILDPINNNTNYDFNNDSKITTNLLNISGLNPFNVPILSYLPTGPNDSNVVIEIITNDATNNNDIFVGDNSVSFRVRNKMGVPISGVVVLARVASSPPIPFGRTNSNGQILNKILPLPIEKLGYDVNFEFEFPSSSGFFNNKIIISKQVKSSYRLFLENGIEISKDNVLQYNVGKYTINGQTKYSKDNKSYYIKGTNQVYGKLSAVDVYPSSSQDLDVEDINNYIYGQYDFPLLLSDLNKEIKTRLSIKILNNEHSTPILRRPSTLLTEATTQEDDSITYVDGGYHNIIEVGILSNQSIKLDLNAPFKANLFSDLNLNTKFVNLPKPGIKRISPSENLIIELIKGKKPSVNLDLNIENGSSNTVQINVTSVLDSDLVGYVSVTADDLSINPKTTKQLSIKFDLNNSKIITSEELANKPITINLNYTINNLKFTEAIEGKISLYNSNEAFVISQPEIYNMDCTESKCNSEMVVSAINKTKTYDFNLFNIFSSSKDLSISVKSQSLLGIIYSGDKDITLKVSGVYENLKGNTSNNSEYLRFIEKEINKTISYRYKIENLSTISYDIDKNTNFKVRIWLQNLQDQLREYGLYGNLCLGVGGININQPNDFYILGNCDVEAFNDCKNGTNAKPKILYNWSNTSTSWDEECVEDINSDTLNAYNENKTHCDSLQMLFSVFKLIRKPDPTQATNKYIYLMSDGVTKDLLHDFVKEKRTFDGLYLGAYENLVTDENIDAEIFKVTKIEIDSLGNEIYTTKPGKYQIVIDSPDPRKPLHIKLKLVREMPYTMRNLLYYIPIDGDLGIIGNGSNKKSARVGYGSSLTKDSPPLPIVIDSINLEELFIYPTADDNKSRAIINLTNDSNNLKNTLRSEGKLLDMTLTHIDPDPEDQSFYIDMTYSPSYPIPLYAKVVDSNVSGFSYKLLENNNSNISIDFKNFLIWQDYKNKNKVLADGQWINNAGLYHKSMITDKDFRSVYGNNNNIKLIKTMMYWPMNYKANNINNITLVLSSTDPVCCDNNPGSKIYSLANLDINGSTKDAGRSIKDMTRIKDKITVSLKDLLDYIDNNACIRSGLTVTTIKWNDENVGFTKEQTNQIIKNSGVLGESATETIN